MTYILKCYYLSNFSIKPNIEGLRKKNSKNPHIKIKKYCIYLYILQSILRSVIQNSTILEFSIGNFSKKRSLFNLLSSPNRHKTSMHQLGNNFYKFTNRLVFFMNNYNSQQKYQGDDDVKIRLNYLNFIKILLLFFSIFFKNIYTNLVKLLKLKIIVKM